MLSIDCDGNFGEVGTIFYSIVTSPAGQLVFMMTMSVTVGASKAGNQINCVNIFNPRFLREAGRKL
jgi:hypothetical protein